MSVDLKALIGKLNNTTRNALEAAAGACVSRTHYDVEIEHYLIKLLDSAGSDFARILHQFDINKERLQADLTRSLDKLKSGNARTPAFSPSLVRMLTDGWNIGSINHGATQIRSGFTILALLSNEELARIARGISPEFQKIPAEALRKDFPAIVSASSEESTTAVGPSPTAAPGKSAGTGLSPHLDQYTVDLTENARQGKLDPVLGRDLEIRQIVDILMRRRQNNPILTGEAGVGKTAVVEGFALRVAHGDVPPPLQNVSVRSLDLALLQAGAGMKGEFENRLKGLVEEVKSSPKPVILFIDEAHTMIGAGGQAGQNDAANILKPALARGELRTIAATTWSEYKKYFEKDAALARRFQVVKVDEPAETQCLVMMRGIVPSLEKHHNVRILDEGVAAAVSLSHRYLVGRQLPDKAVSVLDTACARLALGQNSTPSSIEDAMRLLDDLATQARVLERESATGSDHKERLGQIAAEKLELETKLGDLKKRWDKERTLVSSMRQLRQRIEQSAAETSKGGSSTAAESSDVIDALRDDLSRQAEELEKLQGETPLMRVCVDTQIICEVISGWTGIPVGKMQADQISTVLSLESLLGQRVVGQRHALEIISQRIRTSKAKLEDPGKPIGVFLLVGPSGVGKTETALALADLLYGGERNLITINMSEFQEPHTVSTLKGSPPGYVGYGEGGVLTEAVRRRPYSVVLLDEIEKAHPDVLEVFYQVFDKGVMEDGEGRSIDFKNTTIILTTNACGDMLMKLAETPDTSLPPEELVQTIRPQLTKMLKPAFLGRLVIAPYLPIWDDAMKNIIRLKLGKIQQRFRDSHKAELTYDDGLVEAVARRCTEVETGARNVDNILTNNLLPDISRRTLALMAEGQRINGIHVSVGIDGQFLYS